MPKTVLEITDGMRHIETDTELIFPRVQTCVAVVCQCGTQLVGVHVTLGDRSRLGKIAKKVIDAHGTPSDVYVIGPIQSGGYNASLFVNFGANAHICDLAGFIDVRAQLNAGTVTLESRPMAGGAWTAIPAANFLS